MLFSIVNSYKNECFIEENVDELQRYITNNIYTYKSGDMILFNKGKYSKLLSKWIENKPKKDGMLYLEIIYDPSKIVFCSEGDVLDGIEIFKREFFAKNSKYTDKLLDNVMSELAFHQTFTAKLFTQIMKESELYRFPRSLINYSYMYESKMLTVGYIGSYKWDGDASKFSSPLLKNIYKIKELILDNKIWNGDASFSKVNAYCLSSCLHILKSRYWNGDCSVFPKKHLRNITFCREIINCDRWNGDPTPFVSNFLNNIDFCIEVVLSTMWNGKYLDKSLVFERARKQKSKLWDFYLKPLYG